MRLPEYLVEVQPADAADGSIGDRAAISSHLSGYASARWGRVSAAVQSAVVAAGTERTSTCAVCNLPVGRACDAYAILPPSLDPHQLARKRQIAARASVPPHPSPFHPLCPTLPPSKPSATNNPARHP